MKLGGYRADGTLRVLVPGGVTVLLRGDLASPPMDDREADDYGPWREPDMPLSWQERQHLAKQLDRSRVVPKQTFALKFPLKKADPEAAPAETEVAAPKGEYKPLTKGDLLSRLTEIANAKKAEETPAEKPDEKAPEEKTKVGPPVPEATPKPGPRSTLKRLKLEYESEDRAGEDEKKPVSDVAESARDGNTEGPPATVPDHLQPMEKRS